MIVRHQRAARSKGGFRQLARYIRGRSAKPRATWFLAANLSGVTRPGDLELACRLVEAVNAQNTRAGSDRTYHLVISLHPADRSLDTKELTRVVEKLVETLGFAGHQYIAARHNDKDHAHLHVAILRFVLEFWRADERGEILGLSTSQAVGVAAIGLVAFLWTRWRRQPAR